MNTYIYLVAANADKEAKNINFKDIKEITPHILAVTTKGDKGYADGNIFLLL